MVPGTIEAKRAAVLRGKVLNRDGLALPGVTITILNHPEYGQTLSRLDGMFDLVVNGGGYLTVKYQKSGYLEVQRQLNVAWQDYAWAPDVVLISLDSKTTSIDLASGTPIQVAKGSAMTDSRGTRQSTLLFSQGTQAEIVLPNGTTQPISNLTVRSTEYTVGEKGPEAMPGDLPFGIGYTYAVELTVDEALAAGSSTIRFSQPVVNYLENFLGYDVGVSVPAYYYDRKQGWWVPIPNGRIIKILGSTGGLADLDVDGDDVADTGTKLTDLGITDAERQRLVSLYSMGQSLWRVALMHFSPLDLNYLRYVPDPYQNPPIKRERDEDDPCNSAGGSVIECQNQKLKESIAITGTPFTMNYQSGIASGRLTSDTMVIPLTETALRYEGYLLGVELRIHVAGRQFSYSYSPAPNLSQTFTWDGMDAYGRRLQGAQPIRISMGYNYIGRRCVVPGACIWQPGTEDIYWRNWPGTIGHLDYGKGLAGWTMSVHHSYDPVAQTLYLGTGEQRSAVNQALVVDTVAGNGQFCDDYTQPCGDGGPAKDAQIYPWGVDVGPDGSLYITDEDSSRVRRVWPNGIITTVAGNKNNQWCDDPLAPCGDGGPATQALFGDIYNSSVGQDGSIYIADEAINRIRKVSPDGIITTIAGTGERGFGGDGGPATQAKLNEPYSVKLAPDGNLYIADTYNRRIRRVGPDGIITTVAGNGTWCSDSTGPCGDGGPATMASIEALDLAIEKDGSIYFGSNHRLRKVSPDGTITTVAGTGDGVFSGDGGPASGAQVTAIGLTFAADGSLLFSDGYNAIRRIDPSGIITTIAGTAPIWGEWYGGDNGPAIGARFRKPWYIAVGPNGHIYIADAGNLRLRRVRPLLPGFTDAEIVISSSDGKELYIFNRTGRHLRTVNTLTGTTVYQFSYDPNGLLISVQDLNGNITSIERNGNGNPTAIVGPYGQRTIFSLDSNGYLASITKPAGEVTSFEYTSGGLMTKMTSPRGFSSNMTYDSLGHLIKDENATGGYQALARADIKNGYEVTRTTAMGETATYRVENLTTGEKKNTYISSCCGKSEVLEKTDGRLVSTLADGTVSTMVLGPDPRFSMQSPIIASSSTLTPEGLTRNTTMNRTVSLSNNLDSLSLISMTDTTAVNGRVYTSYYEAATATRTNTSPVGCQTFTVTDNLGRVTSTQITGLEAISYTYDTKGRLASITQGSEENARGITFDYNTEGYVSSITDPLSQTVGFEYDEAGRITRQLLPEGREIGHGYDANGNMISIAPPGRPNHEFSYTPVDLEGQYAPPNVGPGTGATTYTYNLDRQLTQVTRPDGRTVSFAYDAGGRLSSRTIQRGTTTYAYDAQTGNMSTVTAPDGGVLSFTYDGSLLKGVTWQGTVQGSFGLTYDNSFRVVSQSINGGNTISFTYDNDSLLTQAGTLSISRSSQNGLITGTTLGVVTDSRTHTTFGELSDYRASAIASEIFRVQYTQDKLGRITEKTETVSGTSRTYSYLYDASGRLTGVEENGSTVATYTYDANGNRITTNTGTPVAATYDDQDRLMQYGSTTYTYTGNGELATRTAGAQTTTYQYDELGNLVAVTLPAASTIDYVLDGRNRRIGKKVNNVLTQGLLYKDSLNPVAELDGSGNVVSRFVYGTKRNVPDYMVKGGSTYRIISDHLGSVRLVVDTATGAIAQRIDYDAFGNVTLEINPGFQPFGFAGGVYDSDTKLTRFGARDYDAETGRWTAKDPIGFLGRDVYLYGYVGNNPINWIDPYGLLDPKGWKIPFTDIWIYTKEEFDQGVKDVSEGISTKDPSVTQETADSMAYEIMVEMSEPEAKEIKSLKEKKDYEGIEKLLKKIYDRAQRKKKSCSK
jgi:RHS repeat-associated protein